MLSSEAQKPAWRGLVSKYRMGIIGAARLCVSLLATSP